MLGHQLSPGMHREESGERVALQIEWRTGWVHQEIGGALEPGAGRPHEQHGEARHCGDASQHRL
jgi:hypothetical protein